VPRKQGQRAGRAEGAPILHIITQNKATPKASPGTIAPANRFGFLGGNGAPAARTYSGLSHPNGPRAGGGSRPTLPDRAAHWHRDEEGNIERGEAAVDDYLQPKDHIQKLTHEHVKRGLLVAFHIPHLDKKGEGKVITYGHRGVTLEDAEGEHHRVFYSEIEAIRKPAPKTVKKKPAQPAVDGMSVRTAVTALKNWWAGTKEKARGKKSSTKKRKKK
jgi:hypothetical protein